MVIIGCGAVMPEELRTPVSVGKSIEWKWYNVDYNVYRGLFVGVDQRIDVLGYPWACGLGGSSVFLCKRCAQKVGLLW